VPREMTRKNSNDKRNQRNNGNNNQTKNANTSDKERERSRSPASDLVDATSQHKYYFLIFNVFYLLQQQCEIWRREFLSTHKCNYICKHLHLKVYGKVPRK
jgi:hypothetical protein